MCDIQAVKSHQRFAANHKDVGTVLVDSVVVNNVCPFCETVLASKACAIQHVRFALKSGKCAVNKGLLTYAIEELEHKKQ